MTGFPLAAVGWTLIHFVWQGALIGLVAERALRRRSDPRERYGVALAALGLMPLALAGTFLWLVAAPSADAVIMPATAQSQHRGWLLALVAGWGLGVSALALRALAGLWLVNDLRRRSVSLPPEWLALCQELRDRLALALPVAFRLSDRIESPVAAGWFRPMVLLPAAALARLPADQLEALILHELAHLKRLDPFVNLLQIALETLLFYHPMVWRISRIIRAEREHCCDDMAARALGDAAVVAYALHGMETLRAAPDFALAANGGGVKSRIARLLGLAIVDEPPAVHWFAAVTLALMLGLGFAIVWQGSGISAPSASKPPLAIVASAAAAPAPKAAAHIQPAKRHATKPAPAAQPAIADQAAIDGRLERLQSLMDMQIGPGQAHFQRGNEERALRAEIAALRHGASPPADPDAS